MVNAPYQFRNATRRRGYESLEAGYDPESLSHDLAENIGIRSAARMIVLLGLGTYSTR
jgi:hypothetical protein